MISCVMCHVSHVSYVSCVICVSYMCHVSYVCHICVMLFHVMLYVLDSLQPRVLSLVSVSWNADTVLGVQACK